MRRLRIVQVITSTADRYGGPQRVLQDLCRGLVSHGHELSLITTDLDGPGRLSADSVSHALGPEVDVTVARTTWPRSYGFAPALVAALREKVPAADLVHVHGVYQFHTVAACTLARHYSIPYVVHIHGALTPYDRSRKRWKKIPYEALIERRNLRRAAAVIAMTEAERESFTAWLPRARCVVVPPAIDSSLFAPREPPPTPDWLPGTSKGNTLVTFIGRLAEKKGLDLLLDAFGRLAGRHPDAHLIVAGPDDEGIGSELRRQAAGMGIAHRISLTGMVTGKAKRELLRASCIVALPSKDESFGVAIAEALAVGVPVVVTKEVALAGDICAAGAGRVTVRDSAAFAEAMSEVLGDDDVRSDMAANARRLAKESFSSAATLTKLEEVYEAVSDRGV